MRAPLTLALALAALATSCAGVDDSQSNVGPDPSRSAPPPGPLPPQADLLGGPCDAASQPNPGEMQVECGSDHRISVVRIFRRTAMPEGARLLEGSRGSVFWAVEDRRVWVQSVCVMCRVFTETTTIGAPASMTDDQLTYMQINAELPSAPLLHTEAAWQDAFAAWKPQK